MSLELALAPDGRPYLHDFADAELGSSDRWLRRVARGFADSVGAGLFALAATRPEMPPAPSVAFWREFACRYLDTLCRSAATLDGPPQVLAAPQPASLQAQCDGAPPMLGGEYLFPETLVRLWERLDTWVRDDVDAFGGELSAWLAARAPSWHQVGRVCFHLAENKRDPDHPFAFLATYAPRLSGAGQVQYRPLGKALEEYAGAEDRATLLKLLEPVQRACLRSVFVKSLVDSGEIFHPLAWTPRQAYRLLTDVPLLEDSGLLVRLPDWWHKRSRPRVTVTIGKRAVERLDTGAMLDFDVALALGEERLDESELRSLLASEESLVFLRGRWVEVDGERLGEALAHWQRVQADAGGGLSFIEGMRLLAGAPLDLDPGAQSDPEHDWAALVAGSGLGAILHDLREPRTGLSASTTTALHGTLRPYQAAGRDWLYLIARLGLGACLADDMGLGKTVQVLALLLALKEDHGKPATPSLLVLPASLLANWKAEIARFAPSLSTRFVHPAEASAADIAALAEHPDKHLAGVDLVVTSYGMLARQGWLLERDWRLAILDEAQAIKNPGARQTQTVKRIRAGARIALTGTPVENRLTDLWSLFDFLCPGLLGSATRFRSYVKGLEAREHDRYAPLRNLVRPYILRRLKTDRTIIADLPEKTEMRVFCGLTPRQVALYARGVEDLASTLEGRDGIERRGVVLAALMRFKQICNHPSQLLGDGVYERADSGKFERLRALGEEVSARQERMLVFTQFREMTQPLALFLAEVFGRNGLVLHGATAVRRRQRVVDEFQREDGPPFLVLSLKAGGVGLNLTAASHVVHFDRWWNPAVENQATDRAFRIGQRRNVLVHKFVCRGTVEEQIDRLIEDKQQLAADLVNAGAEATLSEMSDTELLATVALDVDRASV